MTTTTDNDKEPEYEFFRWEEGEDLKCRFYDEQGNKIPLRIKSDVVMIQSTDSGRL